MGLEPLNDAAPLARIHSRGRYAPSPTGRLHAGNARTALLAWLAARGRGGAFVMRIEDLDQARIVPGAETALLDDLAWLGLDWDEGPDRGGASGPYRQSERTKNYDGAIEVMLRSGRAYPCACSRADITRSASAPHGEDDEAPRYAGTCRALSPAEVESRARAQGREPAIRFHGRGECIGFVDAIHGPVEPLGKQGIDDFVLRRADGVASYQLAVVVDDAAMAIDEVVRGDDLLCSTPRQIALGRALGLPVPRFAHVPLLLSPGGERIAKRTRPVSVDGLRGAGMDPRALVGRLAASAGLCDVGAEVTPTELMSGMSLDDLWARIGRAPAVWL